MSQSDLSRREFITLGLGILVASSQACAFVPFKSARPKVLIIGAGMAGLSAARVLQDSGLYDVMILEARDRIGGRLQTTTNSRGERLELGAAWIHGEDGNPLAAVCAQYGLTTRIADNWSDIVTYDDNGRVSAERRKAYEESYQKILGQMRLRKQSLQMVDRDISLRVALNEQLGRIGDSDERKFIEHLFKVNVEDDYGTDLDKISFRNWNEELAYDNPDLIVNEGYSALVDKVAAGLSILLKTPVQTIDTSGDGVKVTAQDGRVFEADQVIVTLPLGVLKAKQVQFVPALPPWKQEAIDKIGFASFNKIYLSYAKRFWPEDASWIECVKKPNPHIGSFFNLNKFGGQHTLVGLVSGRSSDDLQKLTAPNGQGWAHRSLKNLKTQLPEPVEVQITRWSQDPFAQGSYSYPSVGETPLHRENLGASVGNSLHFAGEACQTDFYGTVHGAWLSGQRLAQRILQKPTVI